MIRLVVVLMCLAGPALADPAALDAVNELRKTETRAPLSYSKALERIAEGHAEDMAKKDYFSHTGSDGSGIGDRARRAGYGYCFIAENIAKGQRSLDAVMEGWTRSEGHRRNMVDRKATEMGLARAEGNIWVMVLGAPGC
jgi:uncharacterized protein YkwD